MRSVFAAALLLGCIVAFVACESGTSPTRQTTITFLGVTPTPGATIQTSSTQFGGAFIMPGDGKLVLTFRVVSESDEETARLFVYGKDINGTTCMQNLPDAPDLGPLKKGEVRSVTVSGFQAYRTPCEVASFRAVLNRHQDTHSNPEIGPAELIAESTLTARYSIR